MNVTRRTRPGRQRGFVLVTMALTAIGVLAVAGLAVDIGRLFIVKGEMQTFSDAAALAAAQFLNGADSGIALASAAVAASGNRWNFSTMVVSNPTVQFATSPGGPWVASPGSAVNYSYVKVTASAAVPLYLLPLLTGQTSFAAVASAVAAQMPVTTLSTGLAPYTAVSTNTTGPAFGFVPGNSYTIHWPTFNGNRAGCGPADPLKCFNSEPCADDPDSSLRAVVNNWGSQYHGYWGSNNASAIASAVIDDTQLAPVYVGMNIAPLMTAGNKQSEAGTLDQRASQDTDTTDSTPSAYLANPTHNGRRLLPVAITEPVDSNTTTVIGYGVFLLAANGSPSNYYAKNTNGNSAYCATYVGPYQIGGTGPAVGGSTGAAITKLVQ